MTPRGVSVAVLGLVGGAPGVPGGETPRVAIHPRLLVSLQAASSAWACAPRSALRANSRDLVFLEVTDVT